MSGPLPTAVDDATVVVPDIQLPNSELCLQQLQRYDINPLADDSDYGISNYINAVNLLVWFESEDNYSYPKDLFCIPLFSFSELSVRDLVINCVFGATITINVM